MSKRSKLSKAERARIADIVFVDGVAEWTRDGMRFVARLVDDEDYDTSLLGEFTSERKPGYLERAAIEGRAIDPREHRYYVPARSRSEVAKELVACGHTARGAQRMAKRYEREDYDRLVRYGDWWNGVGVVVAAYAGEEHEDTEAPFAEDSVWGVESDAGDYLRIRAADLADECMARRRAA